MSEALNYLKAVRPEAAEAYFTFLRESGKHLDMKTRSLISVITKVDNQTETGFKQYLSRALREGATADEIMDALLVAFPTLGLSKIIWAIDIIRAMDLPEFYPENMGRAGEWHVLMPFSEVKQGVQFIEHENRGIFVYLEGKELSLYDSRCPHQRTRIDLECHDDGKLICPKHEWKFELENGQCIENGNKPLTKFQHKIEEGSLLAFW